MGAARPSSSTEPDWLLRSLAWGAPTVTSAAAAAAVGASPATRSVADDHRARGRPRHWLGDEPAGSRLSWRGYRRVERTTPSARPCLVDRLALWPRRRRRPAPPLPTVELALRLFGTPGDAHVRTGSRGDG